MNRRRKCHLLLSGVLCATVQSPVCAQVYDYSYDGKVERTASYTPTYERVRSYFEKARVQPEPYAGGNNPYRQGHNRSESLLMLEEIRQFSEANQRQPNNNAAGVPRITAFRTQISPPVDGQCAEMLERLQAEHAAALIDHANLVKRQLALYDVQSRANIATVSRKSDHADSDIDSLKATYSRNVDAVNFEAKRNTQELDDYYNKKIEAVVSSHDSLKDQIDSHSGNTKVVQRGTNMYVHNYLNFGGSSNIQTAGTSEPKLAAPVPLPISLNAVAKSLNRSSGIKRK